MLCVQRFEQLVRTGERLDLADLSFEMRFLRGPHGITDARLGCRSDKGGDDLIAPIPRWR